MCETLPLLLNETILDRDLVFYKKEICVSRGIVGANKIISKNTIIVIFRGFRQKNRFLWSKLHFTSPKEHFEWDTKCG